MQIRARLKAASPAYRFPRQDLRLLGAALQAADPEHRAQLKLHPRLLLRVQASASAEWGAAASGSGGSGGSEGSEGSSGPEEGEGEGEGEAGLASLPRGWYPPAESA